MRESLTIDRLAEKIGTVEEIFWDAQSNKPEWIGIGTGFLGTKRVLVPVEGASVESDGVRVRYEKQQVKDSPDIDSDEIPQELERQLYSYYGLQYSEEASETVLPEGAAAGERAQESTDVVRSEEELAVGKRPVEAGRARLRKWVETEPVQVDVELQRETARVTREQINEPVSASELGDEEIEVPLREERPVAEKQVVAKERVGVEKDVETRRETVEDEVRKERVDVDEQTR